MTLLIKEKGEEAKEWERREWWYSGLLMVEMDGDVIRKNAEKMTKKGKKGKS